MLQPKKVNSCNFQYIFRKNLFFIPFPDFILQPFTGFGPFGNLFGPPLPYQINTGPLLFGDSTIDLFTVTVLSFDNRCFFLFACHKSEITSVVFANYAG